MIQRASGLIQEIQTNPSVMEMDGLVHRNSIPVCSGVFAAVFMSIAKGQKSPSLKFVVQGLVNF